MSGKRAPVRKIIGTRPLGSFSTSVLLECQHVTTFPRARCPKKQTRCTACYLIERGFNVDQGKIDVASFTPVEPRS